MSDLTKTPEILADLSASPLRRVLAVTVVAGCGVALIWTGLGEGTSGLVAKLMMVACGGGLLMLADGIRRATARRLILTAEALCEEGGREVCALEDVIKPERGAFTSAPSNGLVLRLNRPMPAAWAPGLWWRVGRRVGLGGVTPASQARFLSDRIADCIAAREAADEKDAGPARSDAPDHEPR